MRFFIIKGITWQKVNYKTKRLMVITMVGNFILEEQAELLGGHIKVTNLGDTQRKIAKNYIITEIDEQAAYLLGTSVEMAIGRPICKVLPVFDDCFNKSGNFNCRFSKNGHQFLINALHLSTREIILFLSDVTHLEYTDEILDIHEILFEQAQDIILYIDKFNQVVNANHRACQKYGYSKNQMLSLSIEDIRASSTMEEYECQMAIADESGVVFESIHIRSDGTQFPVEVSVRSTATEKGKLRIHIIRDITRRKEQDSKIAWLAHHDSLTGVLNRVSFIEEMKKELARVGRQKNQFAILLFDIDGFKKFNDDYGHSVGDLVLKHVTKSINQVLRESDQLGRLGGDEFVILVTNVAKQDDVSCLVSRINQIIDSPMEYHEELLPIRISIGIALYPDDGSYVEELLNAADQAMYEVKRSGGNSYKFASSTAQMR
jgi:diguanylate cyclase (GGDEF)-like protein/PAS domain S-box-containing protein